MAGKMTYDFETALRTLINAQSDVMTLVQKWGELLSPTAQDVVFALKGQDGVPVEYTIPNIQKIVETINERSLPPNPTVTSITAASRGGRGILSAGSLNFAGSGQGATYDTNGVEGISTHVENGFIYRDWPFYRYMHVDEGENVSFTISPTLGDTGVMHMSDFFLYVPQGASATIYFARYGQNQRMALTAATASIWHICITAIAVERSGLLTTGRATRMHIANGSEEN